ncbi:hypothetical protein [Streptomyces albiaxialis]|uniref:hypothetical protein n=1 Tax=Streptomyces albiaxialis TaxID=329523 RepID=UPI0031DBA8CC
MRSNGARAALSSVSTRRASVRTTTEVLLVGAAAPPFSMLTVPVSLVRALTRRDG